MTLDIHSTLMAIVERIREANLNSDTDFLPDSDSIYKILLGDLAESQEKLFNYLKILQNSHYIIVIHLTTSDERLKIKGVDGYVAADPRVVSRTREKSFERLEHIYEAEFFKRKTTQSIIQELINNIHEYKNTPLGQALNAALMLQQFEQIINDRIQEYTPSWKERQLEKELSGSVVIDESTPFGDEPELSFGADEEYEMETEEVHERDVASGLDEAEPSLVGRRAVDTEEYLSLEKMDLSGKWGEAVETFGVEFLLRIHLRKHEFSVIKRLIKQKNVAREKDLRYLRDALRKMELNSGENQELRRYLHEMSELRRLAQLKINQIYLMKKELGIES